MPAASHPHSPTPEEIMAYLDGETPPASRAVIEAHLAGCQECEMVAESFRHVSQRAAEWAVEPSPVSMRMPDAPAARRAPARILAWRTWPPRFVLAGLTAAAAVLLVVSLKEDPRRGRGRAVTALAQDAPAAGPAAATRAESVIPADRRAGRGGIVGGVVEGVPVGQANAVMQQTGEEKAIARTPAVIRTASLQIVAKDFGGVRAAVEAIVAQSAGFIDQMTITGDTSTARALRGTLRVPGDRLTDALTRLRGLGQVVEDTQGSQDVTDQIVDLDARLTSARATEQRLTELLRNRTGKLSDVLEVERELTRVRLDIERLDAEKTNVGRRVSYATIGLTIMEERKAGLDGPLSIATRIRVAAADGLEAALESVALTVLFLLRAGPTLMLWGVAIVSVWLGVRRIRGSQKPMASE
jgi:anti-sigma factor RsiW